MWTAAGLLIAAGAAISVLLATGGGGPRRPHRLPFAASLPTGSTPSRSVAVGDGQRCDFGLGPRYQRRGLGPPSCEPLTTENESTGALLLVATTALALAARSSGTRPALCAAHQLRVWRGAKNIAAGSIAVNFAFVNVSRRRCGLRGYPRVQMVNATGQQIPTPSRRGAIGPSLKAVVIGPGQRAYFLVQFPDHQEFRGQPGYKSCPTSAQLRVSLPGQAGTLTLRGKRAAISPGGRTAGTCGLVFVSAVVARAP
jgi:Protein of unknown function (DUF4232)